MAHVAAELPVPAGGDRLAEARERFLTGEPVARNEVRTAILASWQRSRQWKVAADRIDLSYLADPDPESPLTRSARPVLTSLHEHLEGQPISVILTDPGGLVQIRLTGDHDLERHLDGVKLAPGFSYAEELVGTNGIGTALQSGQPAHVFGHEHYAERLEGLACAGAPIRHPVSGRTIGLVDLTCWRKDADPLMIALAQSTAGQVTEEMLADCSARDIRLLHEYQRTCRHSGGIVLALGNNIVMMNDLARQSLDPGDQAALIGRATEVLASRDGGAVTAELPSGTRVRLYCRPVNREGPVPDGVVHVKLLEVAGYPATGLARPGGAGDPGSSARRTPAALPGLVGRGALWLRACRAAKEVYDSAEWLALEGEPGTGKLALARAIHQQRNPAGSFHVVDPAAICGHGGQEAVRSELLGTGGTVVLRRVDRLDARQVRALSAALHEARAAGRQHSLWVVATVTRQHAAADLTALLRFFPRTVELPPLRHHIEDIYELVPFFLAKLSRQGRLTCSPGAMKLLLRSSWPGNTGQLWQVLKGVVQRRRAGSIHPEDLPPECWTVSRRMLSSLESMERDAIVRSLLDHDGNKVKAAEALGMSRATIYRKIHEYGIVTPLRTK